VTGVAIIVIARAPVPGRCKTRLCPPCSEEEAARIAEASLIDTLDAVAATPASRRLLALAGEPGPWLPNGFEVVPQVGSGLAERLAGAFESAGCPALLVGMDTPQVTPELLGHAAATLMEDATDAVLGVADDGGYWAIGLRQPEHRVFEGVPMSTGSTATAQRARLRALGLRWAELENLRDVDTIEDAEVVVAAAPNSRFAAALDDIGVLCRASP
jgi:rSAM/selenodomain-associated transferase 1